MLKANLIAMSIATTSIAISMAVTAQTPSNFDIQGNGYLQTSDTDRGTGVSGGDPIVGLELISQFDSGLYGIIDNKSRQSSTNNAGLESRVAIGYGTDLSDALSADANIANTWLLGPGDNEDFTELTAGLTYSEPNWRLRGEAILNFEEPNNTLQGEWTYTPTFDWFGFLGGGYAAFSETREDRAFASAGIGRRFETLDLSAAYHVSSVSEDELASSESDTDAFLLRLRARF